MMKQFIEKFGDIEKKIEQKFDGFVLFGLFLPEDAPNKWDLVISAPWLKRDDIDTLKNISQIINEELKDDIVKLSKFVVLETNDSFVKAINTIVNVKNGSTEFINCEFNSLHIKHAFIITSHKISHENISIKSHIKKENVHV